MKSKNVTPDRIMQFAWGYAPTLIISAAVNHGVFDQLDKGPKTLRQLAQMTGASERGLRAIVNALVGFQFLARRGERYALTPESAAFLVSSKPAFLGALYRHMSADIMPKWMQLERVVRTGKPVLAVNSKKSSAAFFADFVEALFPMGYAAAKGLADHLKMAKVKKPTRVLDIAAGSGVWGIALAQQSPHVQMSAADWPQVLKVTKRVAKRFGLANRLTGIPGDILESDFGKGYSVATLGHILHSEGAERSRKLLRKVFKALEPGGTIVIAEFMTNNERTGPPVSLIFAVNMLVATDAGDTFSFKEMSGWLAEAGFVKPRLLQVPGPSPLLLATKPAR